MTTTPTRPPAAAPAAPAPAGTAGSAVGARADGTRVLGLATPHLRSPSDVDHAAARVAAVVGLPAGTLVASSLVAGPPQHLGLVVLAPEPMASGVVDAVVEAAGAHGRGAEAEHRATAGDADRVAVFPGREHLTGVLPVADVLSRSAVDAVAGLGGLVVPDDALLDTRDHVRPRLVRGALVLDVQPARGGRWVPFEPPVQHACCGAG